MEIRFHSKSPDVAWLSNFAEYGGFSLEGRSWKSVEHFYQAMKFLDPGIQARIQGAESPLKAKKAASDPDLSPRSDWEAIREGVMKEGLRAKFGQNRKLLFDTGQQPLIHASSSDLFWGRNEAGEGRNRLGSLLEEVREELRGRGDA
jgi:hypothetical protein